ncbi:DsbC family protein [Duganella vulcania]|uniref:Thiol:disulfide interchange protein n=1 Tax=Duganella vulcania TaxID=2692166 RepID=A0A845GIX8_9BURK|nr:DsbC family protein [Duganella vulcania]MYM92707.1 thioredoxin fold domain-containing protein [Duganella vulcania]
MKFLLMLALSLACTFAQAEDSVKQLIEDRLGMKVDSVTKTDYMGLYEVYANGQLFYTDKEVSGYVVGNIIDSKSRTNVTAKRVIAMLPFDLAIKQVRGNGKKVLVTMEDPNCGYCRRLSKDLALLDDVTIYTFLVPILGGDSAERSARILCAPDRAKAWKEWMADNKSPETTAGCVAPLNQMIELGHRLKVAGTPTLYFENGDRVPGAIPLSEINRHLKMPD